MIQMTQKATYVCWERHDAQGRESMILCNSKRQTDGATRIYHTDRSSDPQTDRQADRQADRQTDQLTHRQTDRLTHRQTDKPPPDRQTDTKTYKSGNRRIGTDNFRCNAEKPVNCQSIFKTVLVIH